MHVPNVTSVILVVSLLLMRSPLHCCYRIIESYSFENGSGINENTDDTLIEDSGDYDDPLWNSSENSAKEHPNDNRALFIDLERLNPHLQIIEESSNDNFTEYDFAIPEDKNTLASVCESNKDCDGETVCNLYSRECERCRFENELCRRSSDCCGGLPCMWGRCRRAVYDGAEFSPCNSDKDCLKNMCCALEHGQRVCKRYLQEEESCELPLGGLVYSLHHDCPCQRELHCTKTSPKIRKRKCIK